MAQSLHKESDGFCDNPEITTSSSCAAEILKIEQSQFLQNAEKELIAGYSYMTSPFEPETKTGFLRQRHCILSLWFTVGPRASHVPLDKEEHKRPVLEPPGFQQCCFCQVSFAGNIFSCN